MCIPHVIVLNEALYYDAFNSYTRLASNSWIIDELERIWKDEMWQNQGNISEFTWSRDLDGFFG
jgi:hypothetical protein